MCLLGPPGPDTPPTPQSVPGARELSPLPGMAGVAWSGGPRGSKASELSRCVLFVRPVSSGRIKCIQGPVLRPCGRAPFGLSCFSFSPSSQLGDVRRRGKGLQGGRHHPCALQQCPARQGRSGHRGTEPPQAAATAPLPLCSQAL